MIFKLLLSKLVTFVFSQKLYLVCLIFWCVFYPKIRVFTIEIFVYNHTFELDVPFV